jgi:type IV secretion system protein VirB3
VNGLRQTMLYRVLYRPNLILGGERELVLFTALVCGGLAVSGMNLVSAVAGAGVWMVCLGLFRLMAKADPYMTKIYLRYLRINRYYPARSRPWRRD